MIMVIPDYAAVEYPYKSHGLFKNPNVIRFQIQESSYNFRFNCT